MQSNAILHALQLSFVIKCNAIKLYTYRYYITVKRYLHLRAPAINLSITQSEPIVVENRIVEKCDNYFPLQKFIATVMIKCIA